MSSYEYLIVVHPDELDGGFWTEVPALPGCGSQGETIDEAVELLRCDQLVAFPTETVYGLGADATSSCAVARIFEAKGRPACNPVIVHASDRAMAKSCVETFITPSPG